MCKLILMSGLVVSISGRLPNLSLKRSTIASFALKAAYLVWLKIGEKTAVSIAKVCSTSKIFSQSMFLIFYYHKK